MSKAETMEAVVAALVDISGIDRESATPEKHIFEDLGVDSLDFLDITFEIDRSLGIKMPIESWLTEAQADPSVGKEMFVLDNFVERVDSVRSGAAH